MAEPSRPPDNEAAVDAFTRLVDLVVAGDAGLTALQQLVDLTAGLTGAVGAAFVEFGSDTARVVAAAGGLGPMLGRPIELARPSVAGLLDSDRVREFPTEELGAEAPGEFTARGLPWMARALARVAGTTVGILTVGYPEGVRPTAVQRSTLALLATGVAHLYALGHGLPVFDDPHVARNAGEAFAILASDGTVGSWNAAAARLTGRSEPDAVGQPWPFPLPAGGEAVEHQMACGRWIEIRSTPVPGGGRTVRFGPRPEQPGSDDDRELFVALTSHELRTPVTVIRGYADTLVEHWDSLDEEARREAVYVIGQRARDLSRLVDRLLMAAGEGAGPMSPGSLVPFDLAETLRDAVDELAADLRQYVRVELPSALPKVLGDRASMVTVVTELVTNACKYSHGRVEVELTAGTDPRHVWLRVADRGVGVRPEHVERAFERFWQMETGDQRRYGGVGLGLYLVRRIVERQHGWVSLRPRQGGGTVAEVRLQRADIGAGKG